MRLNPGVVRLAWPLALAVVVAYGALLRLDAISHKWRGMPLEVLPTF